MEERTCLDPCLRVDLKLAQSAASRGEDSDLDGADVAAGRTLDVEPYDLAPGVEDAMPVSC